MYFTLTDTSLILSEDDVFTFKATIGGNANKKMFVNGQKEFKLSLAAVRDSLTSKDAGKLLAFSQQSPSGLHFVITNTAGKEFLLCS